jgi:UDP-N-acetylglucosamine 4-epimerase
MPKAYADACEGLRARPRRWLVTGSAGFIGSHLVEALLRLGQDVVSLDSFATGYRATSTRYAMPSAPARGDAIRSSRRHRGPRGVRGGLPRGRCVLHEAALGSVPRRSKTPSGRMPRTPRASQHDGGGARCRRFELRVRGFELDLRRSSGLPKVEDRIGRPLSPYAVTKLVDELYAGVFAVATAWSPWACAISTCSGRDRIRMGPTPPSIPKWVDAMLAGTPIVIHGDGETTRDFCHVSNVVQANILAAVTDSREREDQVFNIAVGGRTSLSELVQLLRQLLQERHPGLVVPPPVHADFRTGDVRHSQADISKARRILGYDPVYDVGAGLREALPWYEARSAAAAERVRDVHGAA